MIDLLDDNADCAAIDRALREDEAVDTIPGEIVNAILDGATPCGHGDNTASSRWICWRIGQVSQRNIFHRSRMVENPEQ